MKKEYSELLRDPRWQKKRLEILGRDGFVCQHCLGADVELHVHHLVYARGLKPWEAESKNLLTLCKPCHDGVEELKKEIGQQLGDPNNCNLFHYLSTMIGWKQEDDLFWVLRAAHLDPAFLVALTTMSKPFVLWQVSQNKLAQAATDTQNETLQPAGA